MELEQKISRIEKATRLDIEQEPINLFPKKIKTFSENNEQTIQKFESRQEILLIETKDRKRDQSPVLAIHMKSGFE